MLYFDRIDIFEGIDVYKTSEWKECDIYHYWYLLNKGFKFQANACNWCSFLLIMSMNLSGLAILNIKSGDYCCIINRIRKNEAINLMQTADLTENNRTL